MSQQPTFNSISTGGLVITGAGRGTVTQMGPSAMDAKEIAPSFITNWTKMEAPIVTGVAATHDQAAFPSMFHAGQYLDDPLGEWYLYWSGHDGGGIRLHYADDLLGEWTGYDGNPLFDVNDVGGGDHVASPSAVWNPRAECMNLYYHRGHPGTRSHPDFRQESELATSPDGLAFTKQTSVLCCRFDGSWDEKERSYLRVKHSGGAYVGVYQGRDAAGNNTGIGYAWSRDGEVWETLAHPLWHNCHIDDYDPHVYQHGTPTIIEFGGSIYVLLSYGGPQKRSIRALRMDHPEATTGTPVPIISPEKSWEMDIVEAPDVYYYEDKGYIIYNGQDPESKERAIGIAYTDLEEY